MSFNRDSQRLSEIVYIAKVVLEQRTTNEEDSILYHLRVMFEL